MMSALDTFTANRSMLFGIAYRMLGSVAEAEDMVQETYLRWQKQDAAAIATPKAWLIATTTRLCIDQLRSARKRREEYIGVWLPEPLVQGAASAENEHAALADSLSMAFMLMLEALSPVERAVFLLRVAFDYDYADIARIVQKSEAACRQIVSRARAQLAARPAAASPPREKAEQLMQQFLTATRSGELPALLALLTDDVVLYSDGGGRVRAAGRPVHTAERVGRFFVGIRRFASDEARVELACVNGGIGALVYAGDQLDRVVTIELEGDRIKSIFIVRNPDKLQRVASSRSAS